jgi:hypothetical protein
LQNAVQSGIINTAFPAKHIRVSRSKHVMLPGGLAC